MAQYEVLRKSRDLDRVFQHGRWRRAGAVSVGVLRGEEDRAARVAFVAGRGIGNAVKRNRARRRLREALRTVSLELAAGADIVLLARGDTGEVAFAQLQAEIRDALLRLHGAIEGAPARDGAP